MSIPKTDWSQIANVVAFNPLTSNAPAPGDAVQPVFCISCLLEEPDVEPAAQLVYVAGTSYCLAHGLIAAGG